MGDMNPFWQTLDSVFGAYFNATVNETSSDYTKFFHPVSSPEYTRPDPDVDARPASADTS